MGGIKVTLEEAAAEMVEGLIKDPRTRSAMVEIVTGERYEFTRADVVDYLGGLTIARPKANAWAFISYKAITTVEIYR